MGRSIRNKSKSAGGSAVSDTQLATKADASTVSSLEATVNTKASITNVSATAGELTGLTINNVAYTIPSGGGGGGTTVVANPSGTPSNDLTKVTIGSTDYNVGNSQRNYQYKQITTTHLTSDIDEGSWTDLEGFNGSNTLQITTTADNSKLRVHFVIRGDPSIDQNYRIIFRLARTVGGVTTFLNSESHSNYSQTLAPVEQGYYSDDAFLALDTWEIYYVDTLTADAGSSVSYVPQISISDSHDDVLFRLNRVYSTSSGSNRETTVSLAECEEILTGPAASIQPLFSQQDSIMHEEGTVNFKIVLVFDAESGSTSTSQVQEPDLNDVYTAHYQRIGGRCRMTCSLPIDHASSSSDSAAFLLELVSPPSWMTFPTDGPYVDQYDASYYPTDTTIRTYKTSKFSGSVQSRKMQTNSDFANSISEGSIYVNSSNRLSVRVDNVSGHLSELSFLCDFELTNGGSSPYYRIPSLRANHAYQQRDEQHKIDIPARSGTTIAWTAITDGTNEFSVTITPSSVNAKIELDAIVAFSQARDGDLNDDTETSKKLFTVFAFKRGSTTLLPSASGNRTGTLAGGDYNDLDWPAAMHTTELRYFDEPGTTSPVTYTVVVGNRHTSTIDFQWNRSPASNDDGYYYNGLSTFSAQEIDAAPQLSAVSTTGAQAGQALVYNSSNQWVPSRTLLPFGWQVTLYGWTSDYSASGTSFTFPMPTTSGTSDVASTSTLWGINKYGNYMDTDATDDVMLLEANTRYFLTCSFNLTTTSQRRFFRLELFSSSTSNGAKTLLHRAPNGGVDRSGGTMYHNYANSFTFETGSTPYVQLRARSQHSTSTFHGFNEPNKNQINIFRV